MINRLSEFIESQNVTVRAFEQKIGASNGLIRKAIANNTDIQCKWISKIRENYPHLSLDWLITGEGEMLVKNDGDLQQNAEILADKNEIIATQRELIASLKLRLKDLETRSSARPTSFISAPSADTPTTK